MDTRRTGGLIRSLREERGLTQLQLAQLVGVGDKAVSKWERGGGCPDVSLLPALAAELGCPVERCWQARSPPTRPKEAP